MGIDEILEAKRKLYLCLLSADPNTLTDNEVAIMVLLCKDEQIREILRRDTKKESL